jgi:hypothetical protein
VFKREPRRVVCVQRASGRIVFPVRTHNGWLMRSYWMAGYFAVMAAAFSLLRSVWAAALVTILAALVWLWVRWPRHWAGWAQALVLMLAPISLAAGIARWSIWAMLAAALMLGMVERVP